MNRLVLFGLLFAAWLLALCLGLNSSLHAQVLQPAGANLTDQPAGTSPTGAMNWSAIPASTSEAPLIEVAPGYQPTNLTLEEAKPPAAEDPLKMSAKWNNGLEVQSADKQFRLHVGGRYQLDTGWFGTPLNVNQNINVPYGDGIDFR
ncbi:MAG: hypothetical protein ACK48X_14585, partial [Planctomycetota bacterium]